MKRSAKLSESGLSLYTLPIAEFSETAYGEQVNLIDVPTIRAIVRNLMDTGSPDGKSGSTSDGSGDSSMVLDVVKRLLVQRVGGLPCWAICRWTGLPPVLPPRASSSCRRARSPMVQAPAMPLRRWPMSSI